MQTSLVTPESRPAQWRSRLSLAALWTAILLLTSNAILISPPPAPSYPGAIEWAPNSWLKPVVDLLSLHGLLQTVRGVEIKEVAFHLATVVLLLLLGTRAIVSGLLPPDRRTARGAWFSSEVLLAGWVLLSALSAFWSGDPALALGQATIFGISLTWAIALSWILEGRDVPRLVAAYVATAAVCALLCIWYYYERNPFHRPGFPIGNPSSLAAVTVPAFLITGIFIAGGVGSWLRGGERIPMLRIGLALLAWLPLAHTLWLTNSRASVVGGILGVAGVLFITVTRRARMAILIGLGVLALLGVWRLSSSMEEVAMARGATVRFRLYTWQYAAEMWSRRPISGNGAACFPRAASGLSTNHQKLDPAAFLGEKIAHAHNEFFEILAEIGLIGGLTFVGGILATLVAASGMLQSSFSRQRYLLILGLVAGLLALLGDSLFGVGLRLPGVPPVFYTLLGAVWAQCRSVSKKHGPVEVTENWLQVMVTRRFGLAAIALLLAGLVGWTGYRNYQGLRAEVASLTAISDARYDDATERTRFASEHLLDPIRVLLAREREIFAQAYAAEEAAELAFLSLYKADVPPDPDAIRQALKLNEKAYTTAAAFQRNTPGFGRAAALAGRAADIMVQLLGRRQPNLALAWHNRAWEAWQVQRMFRPYDRQILLALLGFPMPIGDQIGLLRDALRAGQADRDWLLALDQISQQPQFDEVLDAMLLTVAPYTSESDRGALMLSTAPELYRLRGIRRHNAGDSSGAALDAAQAARLYQPLRSRVPTLESVALAELAEYQLHAQLDQPEQAIETARRALDRLPPIQEQKFNEMAGPFRLRLIRYLLAAHRVDETEPLLDALCGDDETTRTGLLVQSYEVLLNTFGWREARPDLQRWIDGLLKQDPGNADGWYWQARVMADGDPEAARSWLQDLPELSARAREAVAAALCPVLPEACLEGPPSADQATGE